MSSRDLTDETIRAHCREHGFPLASIQRRDEILILRPERIEDLPSPDALGSLAERLRASSEYAYITLQLPDE